MQVVVFGGHSAESGWFTRRHDVYHDDLLIMERQRALSWQKPPLPSFVPSAREYHTLTAVGPDRLLLFGGKMPHEQIADDPCLPMKAPRIHRLTADLCNTVKSPPKTCIP